MAQQPRAVPRWCLAWQRCFAGSCKTTSPRVLDMIPGKHWPCKGFGSGWRELGLAQSTQTAPLLWGWGWARLQEIQPWLPRVAALTEQPPACRRSKVFFSYGGVSCTTTSTISLTYLPRKKSIAEKAGFASNSCCHRRLLKNKNVLWNGMWVLPAPQCKESKGKGALLHHLGELWTLWQWQCHV